MKNNEAIVVCYIVSSFAESLFLARPTLPLAQRLGLWFGFALPAYSQALRLN